MMKILKLDAKTEAALMRVREGQDREAMAVAAKIVAGVGRRGNRAVEEWTKKLDRVNFGGDGLWITKREFAAARKRVSPDFMRAVRQAAANVRRVAERQMPQGWKLSTAAG